MPVWTDIAQSSSSLVRRLHAWWTGHRAGGEIPDRSALLPEQLGGLLPNIMIVEIEPEPFRVRYRLVGTKIVATAGFDFTGGYLDELEPSPAPIPWIDYYREVYRTRAPLLGSITDRARAGGTFTTEFGLFPLRNGGSAVAQCVALEDYFGFEATSAQWQNQR
jgi:hypothetical protein